MKPSLSRKALVKRSLSICKDEMAMTAGCGGPRCRRRIHFGQRISTASGSERDFRGSPLREHRSLPLIRANIRIRLAPKPQPARNKIASGEFPSRGRDWGARSA
jgi:hypothetical protein